MTSAQRVNQKWPFLFLRTGEGGLWSSRWTVRGSRRMDDSTSGANTVELSVHLASDDSRDVGGSNASI